MPRIGAQGPGARGPGPRGPQGPPGAPRGPGKPRPGRGARARPGRVARGRPERGRAELGDATFSAAEHAFRGLALEYAALEDVDAESSAMALSGGRLVGIHWMHDASEEALRAAAGCTASYEFNTELVSHIDLDDTIAEHLDPTAHPAEGFPGRW